MRSSAIVADASFLAGGGEMGLLIRSHDWAATSLGEPAVWPQGLRTAVRVMLNTGHPMYVFWGPRSLCFYNDAYAQSLGSERHPSSLGVPACDVWQEIWHMISAELEHVLAGRGPTWHENQHFIVTRNGRREDAWWTYSFSPIDDEQAENGIGGVCCICAETTNQVALSSSLATSEERLNQALSAGGGIGTWDWDVVRDRVVADARFAELYGVDPQRARAGAPVADFFTDIHPDDLPGLKVAIERTLDGTAPLSAEYRIVRPDGDTRWVVATGRCEFDAQRRPLRLPGVSFDITQRKLAETRLREQEAHYRSVVTALREGIVVVDTAGRVISCNPAAEQIVGSTRAEWEGGTAFAPGWTPLRDDDSPMSAQELPAGRVLAGHGPQHDTVLRALDPEGCLRRFEVSAVPVTGDDGRTLIAVVTVFVDATERRRADEELRIYRQGLETVVAQRTVDLEIANKALSTSRDEAQRATRAKSEFLANMSHEIRTPMNAIIGLTHLMLRETRDNLQRNRLGKVTDAAQHLLQIINDILDLSKVEAGKLELERVEFSFEDIVSRVTELVALRAREKALEIIVETQTIPSRLKGDPTRLAQILINLLSNAVKFTDQGWIRLRAKVEAQEGHRLKLRIDVQDTGPGIAPERQADLFTAFTQADNSISRQHGGTGLGLALSRQLVLAMDGKIGLVSSPGAGSTFWFSAWLEPASADDPMRRPPSRTSRDPMAGRRRKAAQDVTDVELLLREDHSGQRILLAEDNEVNREVAQELLQSVGLVVEVAGNGAQAVQLALTEGYDLILMDMQMPIMDGLDASRSIRARIGHAVPIIAMTANAFSEDRAMCLAAGMNDHVAKPVDPGILFETILGWLPPRLARHCLEAPSHSLNAPSFSLDKPVRERLEAVEGLDVATGLKMVGGQLAVYTRILGRFVETYRRGAPVWLDTSGNEAEGRAQWSAACHSSRGALATIGATELAGKIAELERSLTATSTRAANADSGRRLQTQFLTLVAEIEYQLKGPLA